MPVQVEDVLAEALAEPVEDRAQLAARRRGVPSVYAGRWPAVTMNRIVASACAAANSGSALRAQSGHVSAVYGSG